MPKTENTLTYRKSHPKDRCSYGVAGVAGIVVFDTRLFADGKPPKTITVSCNLTSPVSKEPKPKATKETKTA
jgi:hypothetical protein